MAGASPIIARVSASRKVQIVLPSGAGSDRPPLASPTSYAGWSLKPAPPRPRKRMNESRSLIRNSVRSSDSEWLACRISTFHMNT